MTKEKQKTGRILKEEFQKIRNMFEVLKFCMQDNQELKLLLVSSYLCAGRPVFTLCCFRSPLNGYNERVASNIF